MLFLQTSGITGRQQEKEKRTLATTKERDHDSRRTDLESYRPRPRYERSLIPSFRSLQKNQTRIGILYRSESKCRNPLLYYYWPRNVSYFFQRDCSASAQWQRDDPKKKKPFQSLLKTNDHFSNLKLRNPDGITVNTNKCMFAATDLSNNFGGWICLSFQSIVRLHWICLYAISSFY